MDEKVSNHVIKVFSDQIEFLKGLVVDLRKKLNDGESRIAVLEMENSRLEDDVDELISSGKFYADECRHLREFIDKINNLLPEDQRMEVYWSETKYTDEELSKKLESLALGPKSESDSGRRRSFDEK